MEFTEKCTISEKRNTLKTGTKGQTNSEEQSKVKVKREDELDCQEPIDAIKQEKNSIQFPKIKIEKLDEFDYFDSKNLCSLKEELEIIDIKSELLSEEYNSEHILSAIDKQCRDAHSTQNSISKETRKIGRKHLISKRNILSTTSRDDDLLLKSKEVCFQCGLCGRVFLSPLDLFLFHLLGYHSGEKNLKSILSNKRCHLNEPSTSTTAVGNNRPNCKICSKSLLNTDKRKRHLCRHDHKNSKYDVPYKQFNKKPNTTTQIEPRRGKKPIKCEICLKEFNYKSLLKHHMVTHTGEKPFKCEICLKQYNGQSSLKYHMRSHTGEKPFQCEVCLKQFTRSSIISIHMRLHTGEKPFKCEICLKQFNEKSPLERHMLTHTGEKPFKCEICLKQYYGQSSLKYHMRSHTGEKTFKCEVCLKQFNRKTDLSSHMHLHTGEKPFKCEVCLKQFTRTSHLSRHMRLHTGDNSSNIPMLAEHTF